MTGERDSVRERDEAMRHFEHVECVATENECNRSSYRADQSEPGWLPPLLWGRQRIQKLHMTPALRRNHTKTTTFDIAKFQTAVL
jgi:hypothetical protein